MKINCSGNSALREERLEMNGYVAPAFSQFLISAISPVILPHIDEPSAMIFYTPIEHSDLCCKTKPLSGPCELHANLDLRRQYVHYLIKPVIENIASYNAYDY